jgi:hypothetical protein
MSNFRNVLVLVAVMTLLVHCGGDGSTPIEADTSVSADTTILDTTQPPVPDTIEPDTRTQPDDGPPPEPPPPQPTRYAADQVLSSLTPYVVDNLRAIHTISANWQDNVFMKVGASTTVSSGNLKCFDSAYVDLGTFTHLQETLDYFMDGDAAGTSPFKRTSLAAKGGMSANWAINGTPSPMDSEIDAIAPSVALIHYGTNDMGQGSTVQSAIWKFGERMLNLTDELIDQGIIPVIFAIMPRGDKASADHWVDSYNIVNRGVAQARQVPWVDMHLATQHIPGFGLAGDGIHLNSYKLEGKSRPCFFTEEGLQFGYNIRNLTNLQFLERLRNTVLLEEDAPDEVWTTDGDGSPDAPLVIDELPFTDLRDTALSLHSNLNTYTGCDAQQDESGSEVLYELVLDEPTRIRAMVFDRGDVDVDIHLLDESATEAGCLMRAHQIIQTTLQPGTYFFALDTFVSGGQPKPGEYLFTVLECHPDDPVCDP